jgi:DNA-binding SARP family transcriptional activator
MPPMAGLEVLLLGPVELRIDGVPVPVAGPKQRSVLAMLALHANTAVSVGTLIDAVWGEPPPDGAEHTLQQHVSAVRKLLQPDPDTRSRAPALATRSPGYLLSLASRDTEEFEKAATAGFDAAAGERWDEALRAFDRALSAWRGPALADTRDTARLQAAAVRLDEQRLAATEMRFEAQLARGQASAVVAEIEHLVDEHPLRERLRALLMLALYRSGRQADALSAYQAARGTLVDELGIEPGAELRDLEQAILEQRADLDAGPSRPVEDLHATFRADRQDLGRVELPDGQAVLLVAGTTSVGRDETAVVRLVDNRVSRRHAEIESVDGVSVLRDLASTNGTTLNDIPVTEQKLADGDRIGVGGVVLTFRAARADT